MSNPNWPSQLSKISLLLGTNDYSETGVELAIRTNMDSGRIKVRKRFTSSPSFISGTLSGMTSTQIDTLMSFWGTTCNGGATDFNWTHPRTKQNQGFRFVQRPVPKLMDAGIHDRYTAAIQLELRPYSS